MKICSKCATNKEHNQFYKRKESSDGLRSNCKDCVRDAAKIHAQNNAESLALKKRAWHQENKEREALRKQKWYNANKEAVSAREKIYYQTNKKRILAQHNEYHHRKQKTDPMYRITKNLRSRCYSAMKGKFKESTTKKLIGCTDRELRQHLESQFATGMTWNNYGVHGWHIDHVRPCDDFDLSDIDQQRECFHYSNLQPLWAEDNLKKSNNISR